MLDPLRPWSWQSPPWLVRVHSGSGEVKGAGCLVDAGLVVTCAHVVAKALREKARSEERPVASVVVEFPNSESDAPCRARVVEGGWHPAAGAGADRPGDIALLVLDEETPAPADAVPALLGPAVSEWDAVPF